MRIFERIKIQTPEKFFGYSGVLTNIKTSSGIYEEIQFNTDKMIYAKEKPADAMRVIGKERWHEIKREVRVDGGLGHKYYEKIRILNKDNPQYLKEILKLETLSKEYYSKFR